MKNAEKFRKIFKEFATEVWAFPEKDFLTWLNAEYEEPTTKNNLGVEEVTALAEWTAKLTKASEDAYNKGYADGMKAQESIWIPVSERLPEEHNTVIASADNGVVYPEARYSKEDGWEWAYESGADYWTETESDVLAWMPLPKAYREVEE